MPSDPAATRRIYRVLPGAEEVITLRLVCEVHRYEAERQQWKVRPYDGPLPCFLCIRR
jgi:hypothetical protein